MQHSIKTTEKFSFPGFGTFNLRSRKARQGRDPRTCMALSATSLAILEAKSLAASLSILLLFCPKFRL